MKLISWKTVENYMRKIEKQNLDNTGSSISFGSMKSNKIICIRADSNMVEMEDDWKEDLKQYLKQ